MKKRVLSAFLALLTLFVFVPLGALAKDETPCFEALEFLPSAFTSGAWVAGKTFSAEVTEYDLPVKSYSTDQLTLQATTHYDAEKYEAFAEYTDITGEKQKTPVNSGKMTYIKGIPFDSSVLTVTVASKEDTENKTVYTFNVTRPRDTAKTLKAGTGLALAPEGRELLPTKYRDQPEGAFFRADENGTPATGTGISGTVFNYRAYAQNGLESFALKVTGSTEYTHLRYSSDGGNTWKELGQSGGMTEGLTFAPAGAENSAVKILVQVQDDASYVKNGGFTDECANYAVWVEQLPAVADGEQPRILTATPDVGDWYPVFSPEKVTNYSIVTPNGASSLELKYTVADGCTVKLGKKEQTPDGSGDYTLALKAGVQTLNVISADGAYVNSYGFKIQERSGLDVPDRVVDYLPINSQYTNISYGISPEATLSGDLKSLGNFGGYITYYYENGIKDDPKNPYGIDFYIYGNAFIVETTGNKTGSAEPGQVWVSEDNVTYYALAGSEHYNDDTLWDYTVTYTRAPNGKTAWTDNYGNSNDGSARCGEWPKEDIYYLNENVKSDPIVLSGVLLPDENGNIYGDTSVRDIAFGYVDAYPNGSIGAEVNPYVADPENSNGFDLLWAVDEKGEPVDVAGKEFHYIKICTASNVWAGAINEKSTEITQMIRTAAHDEEVGKTAPLTAVVLSDGASEKKVALQNDKSVYSLSLGDMKYVSVKVEGAAADDNIYINNARIEPDGEFEGLKVTKSDEKLVRVIVQNGEKEPCLYLVRLTSDAEDSGSAVDGIKINAGGSVRKAETRDGKKYTFTVGSRIEEIGIAVLTAGKVTINGAAPAESYSVSEGQNVFEIEVDGEALTLTVTREKNASQGDGTISVSFTLLGDDAHGDNGTVHTYKKDRSKLKTWIPAQKYTLPKGSAVVDLFNKALSEIGMSYTNKSGNYVSEINGLAEFTNGSLSGWMYLLNGRSPLYGVAEQTLKNGDSVIFYYTDDYTQETGSEQWHGGSGTTAQTTETKDDAGADTQSTVKSFKDISSHWGKPSIDYVVSQGIMNGVSDTEFAPDALTTRGMIVTILYRLEKEPESKTAVFSDIDASKWYAKAVFWAAEKGVVTGVSQGVFAPEANITREQLAVMLYRYAEKTGKSVSGSADLKTFKDGGSVSDYAKTAVSFAVYKGLINGRTDGTLDPQGKATRAEVAAILERFIKAYSE